MKSFNFLIISILCLIFLFNGCNKEKSRILYFALFPQGKTEGTFLFEIYDDMTMHTQVGVRNHAIKNEVEFYEIDLEKTVVLSTYDFNKIKNIVDKLIKCENINLEGEVNDAWELITITRKNRLHRYLDTSTKCDKILYDLFILIKKISPLKIISNWS